MNTQPNQETNHAAACPPLSVGLATDYWKATPNDPWGCERRCIHCGAGDDANHSYTCPTNMHPDKQAANVELRGMPLLACPARMMGWGTFMIAALYVETSGSYFDLPGVDAWDELRDARKYPGPEPVVAHELRGIPGDEPAEDPSDGPAPVPGGLVVDAAAPEGVGHPPVAEAVLRSISTISASSFASSH